MRQNTHVGWFKTALVNGVEHEATRHTKVEIISSIFLMEHRVVARVQRMNNEHIYFKYGTKAHNDIVLSLPLFFSFVLILFSVCTLSLSLSLQLALFEPRFTTPAMVIGLNVCYLLNVCKWRQFFYTNANVRTKKKNTFHATMLTMFRFFFFSLSLCSLQFKSLMKKTRLRL